MADRYWVGGTASWDATAGSKWSLTSGGAGGQAVPTSADDVFLNAASGAVIVTVASDATCLSLLCTGFTGTLAGSSTLTVSGSFTLATGMTRTYSGDLIFNSTSSGRTLNLAGRTMFSSFTFDGVGGEWTINGTFVNTLSKDFALNNGTVNTNNQTVTLGSFRSSGVGVRALTLGSSTVTIRNWITTTNTNLTFTAGTSTVIASPLNPIVISTGNLTFNILTINMDSDNEVTIQGVNTFTNLTLSSTSGFASGAKVFIDNNQTITGTFTASNSSALSDRLLINGPVGAAITITAAVTTLSNTDFSDITAAGAGSWSGTSLGNALGNTGITFTTPVTRYLVAGGTWSSTTRWSDTSGGTPGSSVPICHDTVILNDASGNVTVTVTGNRASSLTCTGFTGTLAASVSAGGDLEVYGDFVLSSAMASTATASNSIFLKGRGSHTLNCAGIALSCNVQIDAFSGTYTQVGVFTQTNALPIILGLARGTYDTGNNNLSIIQFTTNLSVNEVRQLNLGSSVVTLTGSSGTTVWDCGTTNNSNFTLNSGTSLINMNNTGSSPKTFQGGNKSYNILQFSNTSTGNIVVRDNNTFNELRSTKTNAFSLRFEGGTTQTIETWSVSGSASNLVEVRSTTTNTFNLVKTGADRVTADYLNIRHSVATPLFRWYAGDNSTNNQFFVQVGSGWIFSAFSLTTATLETTAAGSTSILPTARITRLDDNGITTLGFVYGTTSQALPILIAPNATPYPNFISSTFSPPFNATFTLAIEGLTANTQYFVRAFVQNDSGYSYSNELSVTTGNVQNITTSVAVLTNGLTNVSLATNQATNSVSLTNLTVNTGAIINETTNLANLTNL